MNYYFCVDIPWDNTAITQYETLKQLIETEKAHIERYNDWFIIKGEELSNEQIISEYIQLSLFD